ncbi:MAG TPA: L-histidine N(alpha)-methyltransferase [Bryobacteraceae bacterium]|nr:L-histidine N(alpha)-methyltransferase [Bryobacteraceae bacterium]
MLATAAMEEFAADVRRGLSGAGQKQLPPKYFYDDLGSALFDAITLLPEYGLTRADIRILQRCSQEVAASFARDVAVAELGSGSGRKTRFVLEALRRHQPETSYYAIDVSPAALDRCRRELEALARVEPLHCGYLDGVRHIVACRRPHQQLLILFLGSSIGNYDRESAAAFLAGLRQFLEPGDALLIGADLVKSADVVVPAYDDALGVTAAFNKNVLTRMNRELGAGFDLSSFDHVAVWREEELRIEMHLRSRRAQTIAIPGADCRAEFRAGETIWTESSHKYRLDDLRGMAGQTGFVFENAWTDGEWGFAECLWRV